MTTGPSVDRKEAEIAKSSSSLLLDKPGISDKIKNPDKVKFADKSKASDKIKVSDEKISNKVGISEKSDTGIILLREEIDDDGINEDANLDVWLNGVNENEFDEKMDKYLSSENLVHFKDQLEIGKSVRGFENSVILFSKNSVMR